MAPRERRSTRSTRAGDAKSKSKPASDSSVKQASDPVPDTAPASKVEAEESAEAVIQPREEDLGGIVPIAEDQQPVATLMEEQKKAADPVPEEPKRVQSADVQEEGKPNSPDVANESAPAPLGGLKSKLEEPVRSPRRERGDGKTKAEKVQEGDKPKESGRNHLEGGDEKRANVGVGKGAEEKKDQRGGDNKMGDDKRVDDKRGGDKKGDDTKGDHKRADDKRGDDKRADDKRAEDKRADDMRGNDKRKDEKDKAERPRGERSDKRKEDEHKKDENLRKDDDRSKRSARERDGKVEDDKKRESDRHRRDGDRHKDDRSRRDDGRSKRDDDRSKREDDRSKRDEDRSKRDDDRTKRDDDRSKKEETRPRKEEDKSRREGDKEKREDAPRKERETDRRSDRKRDSEKDVPAVALPPPPPLPPNTEVEKVNLDSIKEGGEKLPAKDPPAAKEERLSKEGDRRGGDERKDRDRRRSPPREKDRRERDRSRDRGRSDRDRDRERERDRGRRPITPPRRKHRSRSRSLSPRDARSSRRASPRRRSPPSSRPSNKRAGYYSSGLGGYSPRRRKNGDRDNSLSLSPDRKRSKGGGGAWDQPPPGMDAVAVALWQQQTALAQQMAAAAGANPFIAMGAASNLPNLNPLLAGMGTAQNPSATRSARRLYIGNLPPTVSDGEVLEFLNAAIISGGQQHVPGTRPVAAVQLTLDKGFGFADFTHPEDASIGTLLDGIVLHGNALKIRRPRDYVQPPTELLAATAGAIPTAVAAVGLPGQPVAATPGTVTTASSIPLSAIPQNIVPGFISTDVPDSPNKIFLGNIHPSITAEKLREILTAFGQLKHYVMKHNKNTKPFKVYAYLEYMDSAVTPQAIAGLSGLMLARKPLVSAYATPGLVGGNGDKEPFYGVPEFAKPLLDDSSKVLELSNVLTREDLLRLTEEEMEEIVEDVTLECARFGTVKSSHVPKPVGTTKKEDSDVKDGIVKAEEGTDSKPGLLQNGETAAAPAVTVMATGSVTVTVKTEPMDVDEKKPLDGTVEDANEDGDAKKEVALLGAGVKKEEGYASVEDPEGVGKLYVEFSREESAIRAAHALHNRMFNDRRVMVGYLPVKFYQKRYNKGFGLSHKSYDERQELSIKVQDFLYGPV